MTTAWRKKSPRRIDLNNIFVYRRMEIDQLVHMNQMATEIVVHGSEPE